MTNPEVLLTLAINMFAMVALPFYLATTDASFAGLAAYALLCGVILSLAEQRSVFVSSYNRGTLGDLVPYVLTRIGSVLAVGLILFTIARMVWR